MLSFTTRFAQWALDQLRAAGGAGTSASVRGQALLAGAGLGVVVRALAAVADVGGEPWFRMAMALVVVAAGSLSFVLYALDAQARRWPHDVAERTAERLAEARLCAALLGGGIVGALHALPLVTG